MNNLTKIAAIALAFLVSACGAQRAEVAAWDEVAEQLVPQEQVAQTAAAMENASGEQSGATWFNLCDRKNCDGAAMEYTQAFREAALLASAVRQADKLGSTSAGSEQLTELRDRVDILKLELGWMSPSEDLEEAHADAERGLALAKEQIRFAATHLARVERRASELAYAK